MSEVIDSNKFCELGKAVVITEAAAIHALIPRIDHHFAKACDYLFNCRGKIIVMGMGKSGHIGRKIAATLASTGSPAFFIHPAEASHGDVGMITQGDALLALSNSGETEEILAILPLIRRLAIPLITMTGNRHSTLAKAADINLDTSVEKEACPLGLAPTASTTATLVMGDALAIALLQKKGFTANDFALSHPGGKLGRRLLIRVDEIMHSGTAIPKVTATAPLKAALVEMTQKKLGMTTIVNQQDELVGIFTDGDVRRALDNHTDIHLTTVQQLMTTKPKMIQTGMLAVEALNIMENFKITSLVVIDEHKQLRGVIHMHDILRAGVV